MACLNLHNYCTTLESLVMQQLTKQCIICDVLNIDINRGDDIISINRLNFVFVVDRYPVAVIDPAHHQFAVFAG